MVNPVNNSRPSHIPSQPPNVAPAPATTAPASPPTTAPAPTTTTPAPREAPPPDVTQANRDKARANDARARARLDTIGPDVNKPPAQAEFYDEKTIPPALKPQYDAAKAAYAPAKVVMLRSPGNGEKPAFAVVGKDFDPAKPFNVQTHYHGLESSASHGPHIQRVKDLAAKTDPQTLVVLPESRDMKTSRWTNVSDQAQTTKDAEEAVRRSLGNPPSWNAREHNVSFHSAGGDVLRRLAKDNPKGLNADKVELLDCLYNNPGLTGSGHPGVADAVVQLAKANPNTSWTYRRYENADKDKAPDGSLKRRGEVIQDQLPAGKFRIFDPGKPGGPSSHNDAATQLGQG